MKEDRQRLAASRLFSNTVMSMIAVMLVTAASPVLAKKSHKAKPAVSASVEAARVVPSAKEVRQQADDQHAKAALLQQRINAGFVPKSDFKKITMVGTCLVATVEGVGRVVLRQKSAKPTTDAEQQLALKAMKLNPYQIDGRQYHPLPPEKAKGFVDIGRGSWYGDEWNGKKMAGGEVFNANRTDIIAHKTLPLGTCAEMSVSETGKSAPVQVKDRGPFCKSNDPSCGRVVDATAALAKKLGYDKKGLALVSLRVLPEVIVSNGFFAKKFAKSAPLLTKARVKPKSAVAVAAASSKGKLLLLAQND